MPDPEWLKKAKTEGRVVIRGVKLSTVDAGQVKETKLPPNLLMKWQPLPPDASEAEWQERVVALAVQYGWTAHHVLDSRGMEEGFPDWFFTREGPFKCNLVIAELKKEDGRLTDAQVRVLAILSENIRHVYIWRPSDWDLVYTILTQDHYDRLTLDQCEEKT